MHVQQEAHESQRALPCCLLSAVLTQPQPHCACPGVPEVWCSGVNCLVAAADALRTGLTSRVGLLSIIAGQCLTQACMGYAGKKETQVSLHTAVSSYLLIIFSIAEGPLLSRLLMPAVFGWPWASSGSCCMWCCCRYLCASSMTSLW